MKDDVADKGAGQEGNGLNWDTIHNHSISDEYKGSSLIEIPLNWDLGFTVIEDISITRQIVGLFIVMGLILVVFGLIARRTRKKPLEPNRWVIFAELLVEFIRDASVRVVLGKKGDVYFPYFITLFLVLAIGNIMGRLPVDIPFFGLDNPYPTGHGDAAFYHYFAVPTTSFAFTTTFMIISFIMALAAGFRAHGFLKYWISFVPGQVPVVMKPIVWVFEFISIFVRNIVLSVRIFANIAGGHIVTFVVLYMIVLFAGQGAGVLLKIGLPVIIIPLHVILTFLELLIAVLQAYIFVLLSIIFIGLSSEKH